MVYIETHPRFAETQQYLHPNSLQTLRQMLIRGDTVGIWTNEFARNIGPFGFGRLRREIPRTERNRIFLASAVDKLAALPNLMEHILDAQIPHIVIIDDKIENLLEARRRLVDYSEQISVHLIRLNSKLDPNSLPHRLDEHPDIIEISNLSHVLAIRGEIAPLEQQVAWLIDFNHTLVDTDRWNEDADANGTLPGGVRFRYNLGKGT